MARKPTEMLTTAISTRITRFRPLAYICYILLVFTYVQRVMPMKYVHLKVNLGPQHEK